MPDLEEAAMEQQQQQQQQQSQHLQQQQPGDQPADANTQGPHTMPGILHYLQYEWHRFEVERSEWEVEKAEMSARIALLQGEKKAHENLKHDLIRRIKMLEYCLRMERAKYHKLKHGTEPAPIEDSTSVDNQRAQATDAEGNSKSQNNDENSSANSNNNSSTVTYGRELLKHYLQEIGYTDTLIDLRLNRVGSRLRDGSEYDSNSRIDEAAKDDTKSVRNENNPSAPVDIGELATLTTVESEPTSNEQSQRKQWTAKYRLQSHYDGVRALRFAETDSLLVTASEDETIKLWHLSRTTNNSKSKQNNLPSSMNAVNSVDGATPDIEPLHTYRGHNSRVLSVTVTKNHIFSGAQDGELIMWKIISDPNSADQYDKFDSSLLVCKYAGHSDAVWAVETVESLLCSASADLTLKIWTTTGEQREPIRVIKLDSSPTCIARMPPYNVYSWGVDIALSFDDGKIRLYDITTPESESNTQPQATLECDPPVRVNSIVIHPKLPYLASADSKHDIKFWDLKTQKCKSTMAAHLDEVTSLACDPTGKYLLSASHDCSVRLWLFEEGSCIQEIASHRKKFDEGIFAVAFHPTLTHFATAGADGLAKVFV